MTHDVHLRSLQDIVDRHLAEFFVVEELLAPGTIHGFDFSSGPDRGAEVLVIDGTVEEIHDLPALPPPAA